jgi:hypothetical protein
VAQTNYAFIIRIWHEALDTEGHPLIWRGSIEHVGSSERFHFDNLGELESYIRQQADLPENQSLALWWQSLLVWLRRHTAD